MSTYLHERKVAEAQLDDSDWLYGEPQAGWFAYSIYSLAPYNAEIAKRLGDLIRAQDAQNKQLAEYSFRDGTAEHGHRSE